MIKEHEPGHPLPGGGTRCIHCGAPLNTKFTYSCLERPGTSSKLMPEPARRQYASEAYEAIGARQAELAAERTALLSEPAEPVPIANVMDDCCG